MSAEERLRCRTFGVKVRRPAETAEKPRTRRMNLLQRLLGIRSFVFDMDGVLTDGGLWLPASGEWVRRMHIRDGYALRYAADAGYPTAVISGSASPPVADRLAGLGVRDVRMDVSDKRGALLDLLQAWSLQPGSVLYMGDDVPDLPALRTAGLACCPADACRDVREAAHYVSPVRGGEGCVRDVIEWVLRGQGRWTGGGAPPID